MINDKINTLKNWFQDYYLRVFFGALAWSLIAPSLKRN